MIVIDAFLSNSFFLQRYIERRYFSCLENVSFHAVKFNSSISLLNQGSVGRVPF